MQEYSLDIFVSEFGPHLRYFTGYSGSNGLMVVGAREVLFFTDPRYAQQSKAEVTADWRIVTHAPLIAEAAKHIQHTQTIRIGFEKESSSYRFFCDIGECFSKAEVVPVEGIGTRCMVSKDETELALLRTAASITDRVFTDLLGLLHPGMTELTIAAEIAARHRRYGASGDAFDTIVASGKNSALPHARPTKKVIARGEFITLDFGCVYEGYHSDMTRTIALGTATKEMKCVYAIVLEAQQSAREVARAGMTGKELDQRARRVIRKHGYEKYFIHSLGHGIGLQIHEAPRVSKKNTEPMVCGSVITIEPGIYIPDKFGVRIEDDVVLVHDGCEPITGSPTELLIL